MPSSILTVVRLALLIVSLLYVHAFARTVSDVYGLTTANFFLVFTAAQFHLQFYLSRTLPNFLALPIVIVGLSQLLETDAPNITPKSKTRRTQFGIGLLLAAGIIARSEIVLLTGVICLVDLLLAPSPIQYLLTILPAILLSGVVSTAATVAVDTHLWSMPSFPELEALLFNVIGGHSSEWGVQPWNYYLLSLPKLLLNPLAPALIAGSILITWKSSFSLLDTLRKLRYIILVPVLYTSGFSLLAHKEWRFIIYILPLLTVATSLSAAYIHQHRTSTRLSRLLHTLLLLSIPITFLTSLTMGTVSSTNYPGAYALEKLHQIVNVTNARVHLDVPSRMTGATLPLCTRDGWTYVRSENDTVLESVEYWRDVDYAVVGSLACAPCKRGKGVEGKREWEVIHRQKGYAGMKWQPIRWSEVSEKVQNNSVVERITSDERVREIMRRIKDVRWPKLEVPEMVRNNPIVDKVTSNPYVQRVVLKVKEVQWPRLGIPKGIRNNPTVEKVLSNEHVVRILHKIDEIVERTKSAAKDPKIPWIKLEDKAFVLKHLRPQDFQQKSIILEEKKENERKGLGKQGEVEGQWRDFY